MEKYDTGHPALYCYFSQCQMFTTLKIQAPEMCPINVKEPLELLGVDLIDKVQQQVKDEVINSDTLPWTTTSPSCSGQSTLTE
ncbi:hypothetical protein Pcinc_028691 [Petrolisthes cinctipes]|uniref:Uncharacterized protein n=1 Tax=Petrolisthes cinctipes TaxID=88211 RepID=A0AAE1F1I5_PETCI|nr:hypothetical protein Pcinc_028691 [Petrolisthes cinctipes]